MNKTIFLRDDSRKHGHGLQIMVDEKRIDTIVTSFVCQIYTEDVPIAIGDIKCC